MSHVDKKQSGFTIIELMLAMAFVSVLMVAIAMTVIQLANIYNKGTTLRAVDQAGRAISKDMQYTLAGAPPLSLDSNFREQVQLGGQLSNPDGGRLCTGTYSYIWNTGRGIATPINKYTDSTSVIRLVKVRDTGALYCSDPSLDIKFADATELLSAGDRELAVQSFKITTESADAVTGQTVYRIRLELGTNDTASLDQTATLTTIDTNCKPPSDSQSQRDFCAVNLFDFTVLANNRGDGR